MYHGYEQHQPLQISPNITVEPLLTKHADMLLAVVNESRECLSPYLPWTEFVTNRREAVRYISQRINSNAPDAYWFAIYFDHLFAGVIGIKGVDRITGTAEMAYWLADFGRGHNTINQILSVLIPLMQKRGNAKAIQFHCMEDNLASIRVAERAGATLKEYVDHDFDMLDPMQRLGIYELNLRPGCRNDR